MFEHSQTEERRTEGTAGNQYQRGGGQSRQWEGQDRQQGGQTELWSEQSGQTGGRSASSTGQQPTQQFSHGTGGRASQQSGQPTGSPTGGQMSRQQTGSTSQGTAVGTGGQQMSQQTGQTSQQTGQMSQQSPVRPATVREIAATDVVTTQPDAPVADAARKMASEDVGALVVVQGDRPVGIVTDRKIALAVGDSPDVSQLRVADLMSEDLLTVSADTTVFDLAQRLGDWGIRRVPVVGDRGELRGIVSLDDVIVVLAEEFENVSRIIRKQSPRFQREQRAIHSHREGFA